MKVAYVTTYDSRDVHHWSGLGYYIARALERQDIALHRVGPLSLSPLQRPMLKAKSFLYNRLLKRRFFRDHDFGAAKEYGQRARSAIQSARDVDVVFSPGTIPLACLETEKPVAFWSDATFAAIQDFYPEYSHLSANTFRDGHRIEQAALTRASAAIFSSDWAARSAIEAYGASADRVHVVPFGANIENAPNSEEVRALIAQRPRTKCNLLFMGVDWARKGGATALAVARMLNSAGLSAQLTIVGADPFDAASPVPPFVRCAGFVSKRTQAGCDEIEHYLRESHFLLVPSHNECYGLVFCEANAYGVPSLARAVGGVPTIVRDGVNGYLFKPEENGENIAATILDHFRHYDRYVQLALSSHNEFVTRLNWQVAGRTVRRILAETCNAKL